jgi:hypothetical protein
MRGSSRTMMNWLKVLLFYAQGMQIIVLTDYKYLVSSHAFTPPSNLVPIPVSNISTQAKLSLKMYSKALLALFASFISIQVALTAPAASNECVYLANCDEFEPGHLYSEFDYYNNARSGSQNSQKPDASVTVDGSGYITWEGQQVCGRFSGSGETFCSNIASNGQSLVSAFG